jgi:hypothetical protein
MNEVKYRMDRDIFQSEHYENFRRVFESFDKYSVGGATIYGTELAYQLLEPGVPAINMITGLLEALPGAQFRQAYVEGYNEGVAEFKQQWEPSPNILYGPRSEHYFNDLRTAYNGTMNGNNVSELFEGRQNRGWQSHMNDVLLIVTNKAVKKQGYYAGLVSKYKELELKYEQLRTGPPPQKFGNRGKKKEYKSLDRVHAFILTIAYFKGESEISTMPKDDFFEYAQTRLKREKVGQLYLYVRSTYKGHQNFIINFEEMKKEHTLDYKYAMKIFNEYYPDLG